MRVVVKDLLGVWEKDDINSANEKELYDIMEVRTDHQHSKPRSQRPKTPLTLSRKSTTSMIKVEYHIP
eukprot:1196178-Prorocentrum_minimum.AAC.1